MKLYILFISSNSLLVFDVYIFKNVFVNVTNILLWIKFILHEHISCRLASFAGHGHRFVGCYIILVNEFMQCLYN